MTAAAQPEPRKPRIGRKTADAIAHILEGRAQTQRQAARLAGMSETELSRALRKPHVQAYAAERARLHLRGFPAMAAAARLASLVHSPSHEVAAKIATRITEGAGILDVHASANGGGNGAGTGPVLIVNFRQIEAPTGAHLVQVDHAQPESRAITAIPAIDHALIEGVSAQGGADSGGSDRGEGVEKTDDLAASPPQRAVEP